MIFWKRRKPSRDYIEGYEQGKQDAYKEFFNDLTDFTTTQEMKKTGVAAHDEQVAKQLRELRVDEFCTCDPVEPITGHITLIYDIDCPTHYPETRGIRQP